MSVDTMVRTQIYLTREERAALGEIARKTGRTQSELIRQAVDRFIADRSEGARLELLRSARGLWRDHPNPPDVRALRGEWERS